MDRKMSSASTKLRNLKDFLSSTRSIGNQNQSQNHINQSIASSSKCSSDNASKTRRTKNSISLFNLMSTTSVSDCPLPPRSERPVSVALTAAMEPYGYGEFNHCDSESNIKMIPNKSVSMYGISTEGKKNNSTQSTSRNPAIRLFYTIRSKFRSKRRDRSRVIDSKSTDFGSFLCDDMKIPDRTSGTSNTSNETSRNARYKLLSSKSLDVVDSVLEDHSFIGHRASIPENEDGKQRQAIAHPDLGDSVERSSTRESSSCKKAQNDVDNGCNNSLAVIASSSSSGKRTPPKIQKCLTKELGDLLHYGWYWGGLSKDEAEEKLKGEPNGAFVVRDSSSDHYLLSLSFNSNGRTLHTRIEYRNGQFCFYSSDSDSFPSVAELIEHSIAYSEVGIFCYSKARRSDCPSYPVRLTKPISRFTEVKSLLHLSRFVIRQYVRLDLIPLLPLPSSLIDFIAEQRYI